MAHYILNFGMLWMCRDLTVPVCYSFVAIGSVNQQFLNQLTLALCIGWQKSASQFNK